MTITVTPVIPTVGQSVNFNIKYEGAPPEPDDVHIDVWDEEAEDWVAVVGFETIPDGKVPTDGFDIRVPPATWSRSAGEHRFQVRWTRGGVDIGDEHEQVTVTTQPRPPRPGEEPKDWNWMVFWGKLLGGMLGSAISGGLLNWWTGTGIIVCMITGAVGGGVTSGFGQLVTWFFDAPRRWSFRSAFLFTLFFTLAFSMLFGIMAVDLEKEATAMGDVYNRVTLGVSAVSAFLASTLPGVLDNLERDAT